MRRWRRRRKRKIIYEEKGGSYREKVYNSNSILAASDVWTKLTVVLKPKDIMRHRI